jgi:hypothetical protein
MTMALESETGNSRLASACVRFRADGDRGGDCIQELLDRLIHRLSHLGHDRTSAFGDDAGG